MISTKNNASISMFMIERKTNKSRRYEEGKRYKIIVKRKGEKD